MEPFLVKKLILPYQVSVFKFLMVLHFSLLHSDDCSTHLYANPKIIQTLRIFLEILVDANRKHAEQYEGGKCKFK